MRHLNELVYHNTTDWRLNPKRFVKLVVLNSKIDIVSFSVSRSENMAIPIVKYVIDASLEEVESTENQTKIKYRFALLTNPKNVRFSVEGFATAQGSQPEIASFLESDENNIPKVVHLVYQELFPLFFVISKSMSIPCPAHNLAHINSTNDLTEEQETKEYEKKEQGVNEQEEQATSDAVPEEPTAEPEEQATPDAAPEEPTAEEISSEEKFEDMSTEKLNELYVRLSAEYETNPSEKLREDIVKIHHIMSMQSESQETVESSQV